MARTFASFLRWSEDEVWHPEDSLLPPAGHYYGAVDSDATLKLLDQCETIARSGKDPGRLASCQLQRALFTSSLDWLEVLRAFDEFQGNGGARKVSEKLFTAWRNRTAEQCACGSGQQQRPEDSWITWLLEARRAPDKHKRTFLEHLDVWFECLQKHSALFEKQWRSLALLTRALPAGPECEARFPAFHAQVLVPNLSLDAKLEQSLREALAVLGPDLAPVNPMDIWVKHLHTLVPPPGGSGSYYRESALWMQALSEVNRADYDKLLAEWRVVHRRRRNLWADMAALKLPGL
jgi:hypothetical protein